MILTIRRGQKKHACSVTLERRDGRIYFVQSPMVLKDEIKTMRGAKWDGRAWSIDDCNRNDFRLKFLAGENVYAWFDRPIETRTFQRPLMPHQIDLVNALLTYRCQIWAAEMGVGKTLAAQEGIERVGGSWWWVGPKTSLPNIAREFRKWDYTGNPVDFLTYDALVTRMRSNVANVPIGIVFDESSRLKTATSLRSKAAQAIADLVRAQNGYVILMSGTPSPKTPLDWFSQCEICWPGFLREGSVRSLESRLAFQVEEMGECGKYMKRLGWRDDENKCLHCGELKADHSDHAFVPSINEIETLYQRLKGLVVIKHKKDCLSLPDKQYRRIECPPSPSVLRVAKALGEISPTAIMAATLLRELSDGFQYRDQVDGTVQCNHCTDGTVRDGTEQRNCPLCKGTRQMPRKVRITKEVPCPKDQALLDLLEECEETGRIVIFAGFVGSVDRITNLCSKRNWAVVRCDGRGFATFDGTGAEVKADALDYWADREQPRVAFVAHPESGGMSLTLTESRMAVFWSNSFKPEFRVQAEDRIHRKGMDENKGCTIVDLVHLPSDDRVLSVIKENRRLELMTLGEFHLAA